MAKGLGLWLLGPCCPTTEVGDGAVALSSTGLGAGTGGQSDRRGHYKPRNDCMRVTCLALCSPQQSTVEGFRPTHP
jgi:hypothetical protein